MRLKHLALACFCVALAAVTFAGCNVKGAGNWKTYQTSTAESKFADVTSWDYNFVDTSKGYGTEKYTNYISLTRTKDAEGKYTVKLKSGNAGYIHLNVFGESVKLADDNNNFVSIKNGATEKTIANNLYISPLTRGTGAETAYIGSRITVQSSWITEDLDMTKDLVISFKYKTDKASTKVETAKFVFPLSKVKF